jgi:hypothetical protein
MPAFKYTMIFTYFSGITATNPVPVRLGGWSESYYSNLADTVTIESFVRLIQARLSICPRGTVVTKYRVQQVDPTLASQLRSTSASAPATWLSDVPQMALKVQFLPGAITGAFLREFRGLPDIQVTVGEYSPSAPFTTSLTAFMNVLTNGQWRARRRDRSQPKYSILSIDPTGLVVMTDPFVGVAVGQQVQVIRTVNPMTGRKFGYFAKVQAVTDTQHFQIVGPKVRASGFGQMRAAAVYYALFTDPAISEAQAVVRKVGRPLRAYSGRASKRQ